VLVVCFVDCDSVLVFGFEVVFSIFFVACKGEVVVMVFEEVSLVRGKCLVMMRYFCSVTLICWVASGCRSLTWNSSFPTIFFLPSTIWKSFLSHFTVQCVLFMFMKKINFVKTERTSTTAWTVHWLRSASGFHSARPINKSLLKSKQQWILLSRTQLSKIKWNEIS
jgi:hypothetical protein